MGTSKAKEMVHLLEQALSENIGVRSVTVDGQTVTYESQDAMIKTLEYWRREATKAGGRRPLWRGFDLSGL
jgi:hypothetical protein